MKPFSSSCVETLPSVSEKKKKEELLNLDPHGKKKPSQDVNNLALSLEKLSPPSTGTNKPLSDDRSGRLPRAVTYIPWGGGGSNPEPCPPDLLNSCNFCCSLEHAVASCPLLDCIPKVTVLCSECSIEHWPYPECPFKSCKVCFSPEHLCVWCPYFDDIPKGADYNRVEYETICQCGNTFNEEKWVCAFCGQEMPRVQLKSCDICDGRHCSHECPIDKVQAAEYKAIRDQELKNGPILIPYSEEVADAVWGESTSSWAEANPFASYIMG
ncbi:hypothetical protein PHJA_002419900 [Phtheirospermum japonicum]|uniref:4Fe-4S ferredoxin-type domain-containing protein n=1 Tax=Phtheirospermum japonicum TaxID=374723 RepID=A0A830CUQ2_9LAMI|nr:hypothetical protein PHJA_002419900 [Phtheirospermum japonicum]